jgi:hypothetical protein
MRSILFALCAVGLLSGTPVATYANDDVTTPVVQPPTAGPALEAYKESVRTMSVWATAVSLAETPLTPKTVARLLQTQALATTRLAAFKAALTAAPESPLKEWLKPKVAILSKRLATINAEYDRKSQIVGILPVSNG